MAILDMYESCTDEKVVSIKSMAERQQLSIYYLEQLFSSLKNAGIVKSIKGPGGGYIFAKPTEQIFLSEILEAVGENIKITKCGIENKHSCHLDGKMKCNSHKLWYDLGEYILVYLKNTSLVDIANNNFFFKRSL